MEAENFVRKMFRDQLNVSSRRLALVIDVFPGEDGKV